MCMGGGGDVSMNTWHYCADCVCEGVYVYPHIADMSVCTISMEQFFAILYVCVYAND